MADAERTPRADEADTVADEVLVQEIMDGKPEASMGIAVGDVEGDGDMDLFMTHLNRETNTFYVNMNGQYFEDRTADSGLGADSLPLTGFGAAFLDHEVAREIFGPRDAVLAWGPPNGSVKAVAIDGGYRVTGNCCNLPVKLPVVKQKILGAKICGFLIVNNFFQFGNVIV